MPTRSPRIVPVGLQRGSILIAILCGTIAGIATSWWYMFATDRFAFMGSSAAIDIPVMLAPVVLVVLWIQLLAFYTPRRRNILLAAIAGSIAIAPAFVATEAVSDFNGDLDVYDLLFNAVMLGMGSAIFVAFGVCLGLCARWIAHAASRPVEQTGTYCWHCAYDLSAGPTGAVCPECGIDPIHATPRWRLMTALMGRLSRHARAITAVAAAIALAATVWWTTVWIIPVHRFVSSPRMATNEWQSIEFIEYARDSHTPNFEHQRGINISLPVVGRSDRIIKVLYLPRAGPDTAAMIVEFGALERLPASAGGFSYPTSLYPSVRAYLTIEQARAVMSRGVPQSLIDTLIAHADAANAIPMPAVTANSQYHSPIAVDAAPFFPGLTPYTGPVLQY